jgi:hypothetical protein
MGSPKLVRWRAARRRALASAAGIAALGLLAGCARPALPDPRAAAEKYARAAQRGDADAIHAMLTSKAQRAFGRPGTRRMVLESRQELLRQGRALSSKDSAIQSSARVRFADGEQAELEVEDGEFKIRSAGALPAGARTPVQALEELRAALARRSYASLMRVLGSDTRSALENDLRSLVNGLEEPETLDVKVSGDRAEVEVPGGHSVKLRREAGVWRVEDFD